MNPLPETDPSYTPYKVGDTVQLTGSDGLVLRVSEKGTIVVDFGVGMNRACVMSPVLQRNFGITLVRSAPESLHENPFDLDLI